MEEIRLNVLDMRPRIIDLQFSNAMGILKPSVSPLAALQQRESITRRSQPWMSGNAETANLLTRIGDWIFSSQSSFVVLQAPARTEAKAKEIAVEVIKLLKPTATRVAWYLSTGSTADHGPSMIEILKSLAFQLISFDTGNIQGALGSNLNATKLQQEHSEREWADLVYMILQYLSRCFIVIEAEDVYKTMGQDSSFFDTLLSTFHPLIDRACVEGLRVKILLVAYGKSSPTNDPSMKVIPLQPSVPVPANRRRAGTRPAFHSPGWHNLRCRVAKEQ